MLKKYHPDVFAVYAASAKNPRLVAGDFLIKINKTVNKKRP